MRWKDDRMSKQKIGEFVVMVWKKIFKRKLSMIAWFGLGYLPMMGAVPSSASTAHLDQAPTPVPNSPLPLRRDAFFTPAGFLYPVVVKGISNGP